MKSSAFGFAISILIIFYFFVPKPNIHETQIKSLAFSYGIYNHHSVCPNVKKLDSVKDEYKRHLKNISTKDKQWIDRNFNKIFKDECLKFEIKRSGDDYV